MVILAAPPAAAQGAEPTQAPEFVCQTDKKPSRQSYRDRANAKAVYRCEFIVPEVCVASLKFKERVTLSFDISVEGVPGNISVVKSTNECLNAPAASTLSLWRYELLQEPEIGAEVTFKIYGHSSNYRNQNIMRDLNSSGVSGIGGGI